MLHKGLTPFYTKLVAKMTTLQSKDKGLNGLHELHDALETSPSFGPLDPRTLALHADEHLNHSSDVAPPVHVSTIFRYNVNPNELKTAQEIEVRRRPPCEHSRPSCPLPRPIQPRSSDLISLYSTNYPKPMFIHATPHPLQPASNPS